MLRVPSSSSFPFVLAKKFRTNLPRTTYIGDRVSFSKLGGQERGLVPGVLNFHFGIGAARRAENGGLKNGLAPKIGGLKN